MSYEVRLRPADRQWPDWLDAQWAKIARALDHLEAGPDALARPLDMGQLALACALGYLDLRHGPRDWRQGRTRLSSWEAEIRTRPSLAGTRPT
jgi:glutathione S-transferase